MLLYGARRCTRNAPSVCYTSVALPTNTQNVAGTLVDRSLSLDEKPRGSRPGPGTGREPGRPAARVNNMRPRAESDVDGHRFFQHRTILERATARARERRQGRVTDEKPEGKIYIRMIQRLNSDDVIYRMLILS